MDGSFLKKFSSLLKTAIVSGIYFMNNIERLVSVVFRDRFVCVCV